MHFSILTKSKSKWSSVQVVGWPGLLVTGQHPLETRGSLTSQMDSPLCLARACALLLVMDSVCFLSSKFEGFA